MKKRDKIYCIKTIEAFNTIYFKENKYYTIKRISKIDINIQPEMASDFYFELRYPNSDIFKFNEHFTSIKKIRKLKINKLYEKICAEK